MPVKLLSVKEASNQLGVSERGLWDWIYARRIEIVRLGRCVRIRQSVIDEFVQRGTIPAQVN
jgi:excisionase family DNA binding protein